MAGRRVYYMSMSMAPSERLEHQVDLRLFIHEKRPGVWIAQAVNYDLNAQGRSLQHALHAFALTLAGQILLDIEQGRAPLSALAPPPAELLMGFEHGLLMQKMDLPIPENVVPPPWVIKAQLSESRIYSA